VIEAAPRPVPARRRLRDRPPGLRRAFARAGPGQRPTASSATGCTRTPGRSAGRAS